MSVATRARGFRCGETEFGWHHADDQSLPVIDFDLLTNHIGRTAEMRLPE